MTYLDRVALEIKTVGLYDLVLQDVQKIAGKNRVSEEEILKIMDENPQILEDYKQVNIEYNLSNIHLRNIEIDKIEDEECKSDAVLINKNLDLLREMKNILLISSKAQHLLLSFL